MRPPGQRERKLVTVLFADLVGFTARAESLDPEDVEAILAPYHARLRAELERFGGTVEKFIGDAVMAVFGAPVAHEDDPERAVRAALAIREAARDDGFEVRIAVNTGEALVTVDARPEAGDKLAAGDVVNTAARLQSAAPVNGVLVGEQTYRATQHVIDYRGRSAVDAKGKAQPVAVWEAVEARARFGVDVRQHGAAPLVGRERELRSLLDVLERARSTRELQFVTLVGVPGIGKSRLIWELFQAVDADPELITWRQGRSLPYGEGVSFWALGEMVKAQAGILETDGPERAAEKLGRAVRETAPERDAEWIEDNVRPLVGLGARSESTDTREEAFAAWRLYLESIADRGPLVLVFEDLHWADDGLLDFIDHLAEWTSDVPLLLVCSARPELLQRRPGWGGGKVNAATLAVGPLADDDAARLIAGLLDRALLPAETQRALLERAGGNPLYAEQYALLFRERGSAEDLPLPETVQGIIAARLDGLPAAEKRLLQDGAVVGKVFWAGVLAALDGAEPASLRRSLHALERKEFVRRERRPSVEDEDEYAFRHVLVRDVAYGQIPRADRVEKHFAAARWIESLGRSEDHAEMLAHHYVAALDLSRAAGRDVVAFAEPARLALRAAGDRAFALNAYVVAEGFYRRAVELWPEGDSELPYLVLRYGLTLFTAHEQGEEELTDAVAGLTAAGDPGSAAEAQTTLVELAWKSGRRDEASERLDRAQRLVADLEPSREKAFVLSNVSRYLMLAARNEEAIAVGREALEMAERLELVDLRAHALINIGPARAQLGDLGGLDDLERAITIANEVNSPEALRGYVNLAATVAHSGDMRRTGAIYEEALPRARRLGHGPSIRWLTGETGTNAFFVGDWDHLERVAAEFEAAGDAGNVHYLESSLLALRGYVRLARGDVAGAERDSEKALELARAAKDPQTLGPALAGHPHVLFSAGRLDEARALVDEFLSDDDLVQYGMPPSAAWAAMQLGRREQVEQAFARTRRRSLWIDAIRAFVAEEFAGAADTFHEIGSLPDEADSRLRAAEQLIGDERLSEAAAQLRQALAFWRSVRATALIREAEGLLAATAPEDARRTSSGESA